MWKVSLLEKLKPLLLGKDWCAVSIYVSKGKVYVYIDGSLEFEASLSELGGKDITITISEDKKPVSYTHLTLPTTPYV